MGIGSAHLRAAIVAAGVLLAVVLTGVAQAQASLRIGTCQAAAEGAPLDLKYRDVNCVKPSTGEDSGGFEFEPMPLAANTFEVHDVEFVFKGAAHQLYCTLGVAGPVNEGEFSGPRTMLTTLRLGCWEKIRRIRLACGAPGEPGVPTTTAPLTAALGYIDSAGKHPTVGWQLEPVTGSQLFETECPTGHTIVTVSGSAVFEMKKPMRSAHEFEMRFAASGGHQVPEALEGGATAALTMTWGGAAEPVVLTSKNMRITNQHVTFVVEQ